MNRYEEQGDPDRILAPQSPMDKPPVGGWLLVFCIINIFGVIKTLTTIFETQAPLFLALHTTLTILTVLALITLFTRASSALTCVSFSLAAHFLYRLLQIYVATRMSKIIGHATMSPSGTEFSLAFGNILGAVTWYLYFHLSTRVRQTLGRNL